jgi:hypothetical protein
MGEPLVRVVVSISYDTLPCCLQDCAFTFGEHGFPNLTDFSLAKTRGSGYKTGLFRPDLLSQFLAKRLIYIAL